MIEQWTVMFIDMVSSTALKYEDEESHKSVVRLYGVIQSVVPADRFLKFTGDGAMVAYKARADLPEQAPLQAMRDASTIIRNIDQLNYRFDVKFPIHLRVGIATGDTRRFVQGADDLIGKRVDLASRLCTGANKDGVLADDDTLIQAQLVSNDEVIGELEPGTRIKLCDRRLDLKGVPPRTGERFWDISVKRFIDSPAEDDSFKRGLVALYLDREELKRDFTPMTLLERAETGSTLIVAGRTLLKWTEIDQDRLFEIVKTRGLKLKFVIASEYALKYLDPDQLGTVKNDFMNVLPWFRKLVEKDWPKPQHVWLYESDLLIVDGIVCAKLSFDIHPEVDEKEESSFPRYAALQDINAVLAQPASDSKKLAAEKGAMLWVCNCPGGIPPDDGSCTAHGLYRRTEVILDTAKALSPAALDLEVLLRGQGEGLASRNNHPRNYLPAMKPYLDCIVESRFDDVPPPVCVQVQISSRCSTWCTMCDHWREGVEGEKEELSLEDWQRIFASVAECGARTVILSGGEPLERHDIAALLRSARRAGLRVGLLTNGIVDRGHDEEKEIFEAVAASADWVAVSVDGTQIVDEKIRNPHLQVNKSRTRSQLLRAFRAEVKARNPKVNFSATVTLQSDNILMDLEEACRFINGTLDIPQANFKFATGARRALKTESAHDYRLRADEVEQLAKRLQDLPLRSTPGNNLEYLRRTLEAGIYSAGDVAAGAPLYSYYKQENLRCFTLFLFSLIDSDGAVYPCCHLYRDNHPMDRATGKYRGLHRMGDLRSSEFNFKRIWTGKLYAEERRHLATIDPDKTLFEPCGECTRHCQHNSMLTRVERLYRAMPQEVGWALQELGVGSEAVWF